MSPLEQVGISDEGGVCFDNFFVENSTSRGVKNGVMQFHTEFTHF